MDSDLVVKQMSGRWKINAKHLLSLFLDVKARESAFKKVEYKHVPRTNQYQLQADRLANEALDSM